MKKSVVGVYIDHHHAVEAAKKLLNNNLSKKDITLVGRIEDADGELMLSASSKSTHAKPAAIGSTIGAVAGILTGVGIFAIPGLGFLYGAGALVGAIAGFDFGLIGGGLVALTETLSDDEHKTSLAAYMENHHLLVVYTGSEKDKAESILKEAHAEAVFH